MSQTVDSIAEEIFDLFPKETEKYKELIRKCINDVLNALPPNVSKERYIQAIKKNIELVRDGKLE
jgi:hypothetical protein